MEAFQLAMEALHVRRCVGIQRERLQGFQDAGLRLRLDLLKVPLGLAGPDDPPRRPSLCQAAPGGPARGPRPSARGERRPSGAYR